MKNFNKTIKCDEDSEWRQNIIKCEVYYEEF